ncbi:MAG: glycine cleavage system aminomethyltransferase GcvT [Acidobacteria bacterium]|nr:glycine cleavage system aminomethyltransferase GcvT [Acidobacteriota bacterium]
MDPETTLRRTSLHAEHVRHGARLVPFAGWEMPIQYRGVLAEHAAVRASAGLFDVSHMGELEVYGAEAEAFLQEMTPNNVSRLATGQAQYTALLTAEGTFVDDLLIYRLAAGRFLLVVNAANTAGDLAWIRKHIHGEVQVRDLSGEYALLALQGPRAAGILGRFLGKELQDLGSFRFTMEPMDGSTLLISRTGYTGEDGFEIYLPPAMAPSVWQRLMDEGERDGLVPVGLGARDTLRLEAALPLYGQDIDMTRTPLEAGLNFIVKLTKGEFMGREALVRQKEEGVGHRLTGLAVTQRGIARPGYPVRVAGREVGVVTSGTHSPTLGRAIGMSYLPVAHAEPGTKLTVVIRGNEVEAEVVPLPFYRRPPG